MIEVIASSVFALLTAIAVMHFVWASGSTWPVANQQIFMQTFVGVDGDKPMPGAWLTSIVALLILFAGVLALWSAGLISLPLPEWCRATANWVLFSVFFLRGASTYALPNLPRTEPFRSLDRRYFAPLCLALAAGYLLLGFSLR